jgi:predicted  nucleic acid-binding Zn-ribbon protein
MEPTLTDRVESLEEKVSELATLPKRVESLESQILQLRVEMRGGFAAVRQEIRDGDEETRRYMRVLHEEVLTKIATISEGRNTT